MTTFVINILLALIWMIFIGENSPMNFLIGFGLGYTALWFSWRLGADRVYFRKFWQVINGLTFFTKELIVANVRVAIYTVSPLRTLKPGILAIPVSEMSDVELTILANVVTLTPGTLTIDISDDRHVMFVHFMNIDDAEALRVEINEGFEALVKEIMR